MRGTHIKFRVHHAGIFATAQLSCIPWIWGEILTLLVALELTFVCWCFQFWKRFQWRPSPGTDLRSAAH